MTDGCLVRLAQASSRLHQRIEYRLQIEGRAADDLEHVGGGGLLLQRFAQLVEQPRVLDGDDGLGGEVRDQRDLLVGERANLLPVNRKAPISSLSLSIGTASTRPRAAELDAAARQGSLHVAGSA